MTVPIAVSRSEGIMSSDNVSTTAPEGRKSTKPIMEKRRRARINACLAELKSLLMDVIKAEGARHSKMEKADILEMTVRHLRQLQRQTISGIRTQDTSTHSKYRMGYLECINEVGRFLGSLEIEEVELRTKIIDHLANCVAGAKMDQAETEAPASAGFSHTSAVIRPRPEKPNISLINRTDICSLPMPSSSSVVTLNVPQIIKSSLAEDFKTVASTQCMSVINLYTPSLQHTAISSPDMPCDLITPSQPNDLSKTSVHFPKEDEKQRTRFPDVPKPTTCDIQPKPVLMSQPDININYIGTPSATTISPVTSAQIFGGLQLVPKQLPSGEVVFIVPTNIIPSTQSPSYIIPILSPNTSPNTSSFSTNQTTDQSPSSNSVSNVIPTVGLKPVSVTSVTPIVPIQSSSTNFSVCDTKTIIRTCADTPVLQDVCDTSQNNHMKLTSYGKPSNSQSTVAHSDMRSCIPQYFIPKAYTCVVPSVSGSHVNGRERSKSPQGQPGGLVDLSRLPTNVKELPNKPILNERTIYSSHVTSGQTESKMTGNILASGESAKSQDTQFCEHLVLNLAMQNRTRAENDGTSRNNFQEEDENMWRPW